MSLCLTPIQYLGKSGEWMTILELGGAAYLACRSNLVSASSWFYQTVIIRIFAMTICGTYSYFTIFELSVFISFLFATILVGWVAERMRLKIAKINHILWIYNTVETVFFCLRVFCLTVFLPHFPCMMVFHAILYTQATAWLTNATRSLETPFGRLTHIIDSPTSSSYNVYGTIDNIIVRRNRIGQNFGKTMGQWYAELSYSISWK